MPDPASDWKRLAPPPRPLTPGQKWHVFLSYRSVNRPWVINLYDVLRGHGHQVFLDQCAITAGDALISRLENGLAESQAGVLVWSTTAADSEWVRREYETMEMRAEAGDFRFVPVRLDARDLPLFARRRVFLDFSQYPDGPNGGELLRLLHAVVGLPLSDEAMRVAASHDEAAKAITAKVKALVRSGSAATLRELFETGGPVWESSSALGCAVAEGLVKLKHNEDALAVLNALERRFPRAIRPKQLRALALARRNGTGDLELAQQILGELIEAGQRDPETLGIYGRTWMDRYAKTKDVLFLRHSRDQYAEAFAAAQDDYYTGLNAAAKSVLLGSPDEIERGREIARRVRLVVGRQKTPGDYWKTASAAEVGLILGDLEEAAGLYGEAVAMAPTERGSHESTWQQACRLMAVLGPTEDDRQRIRSAFQHLPDCQPD